MVLACIGTVVNGVATADRALQPGATVSAQVCVALAAFLAVGAAVGGCLLVALAAMGRPPARRSPSRETTAAGLDPEELAAFVVGLGWSFFHLVDVLVIAPGETPGIGVWTRLLVAGLGFVMSVLLGERIASRAGAGDLRLSGDAARSTNTVSGP